MPNLQGGRNYKRGKSNRERFSKKENVNVDGGEGIYCKVIKSLGGKPAQFEVLTHLGTTVIVMARGKMQCRDWIKTDMFLVANNDYEITRILSKDNNNGELEKAIDMINNCEGNTNTFDEIFNNNDSSEESDNELLN